MKLRHLAMGGALLATSALLWFGDNTPAGDIAEAAPLRAPIASALALPAATASTEATANAAEPVIIALKPRAPLNPGDTDPIGGAETVFVSQNWTPPPLPAAPQAAAPPPAPTAPPLPFTYLGKAVGEGAWEVFLIRADRTFIVRIGMLIDGVYRVDTIAPPVMTLTYLPLNQVQQLNIGVLD